MHLPDTKPEQALNINQLAVILSTSVGQWSIALDHLPVPIRISTLSECTYHVSCSTCLNLIALFELGAPQANVRARSLCNNCLRQATAPLVLSKEKRPSSTVAICNDCWVKDQWDNGSGMVRRGVRECSSGIMMSTSLTVARKTATTAVSILTHPTYHIGLQFCSHFGAPPLPDTPSYSNSHFVGKVKLRLPYWLAFVIIATSCSPLIVFLMMDSLFEYWNLDSLLQVPSPLTRGKMDRGAWSDQWKRHWNDMSKVGTMGEGKNREKDQKVLWHPKKRSTYAWNNQSFEGLRCRRYTVTIIDILDQLL